MNYNKVYDEIIQGIFKYSVSIITGFNGSGKTTMIKKLSKILNEQYNEYEVIFLPDNRKFYCSKEEMESIDVINKLNNDIDIKQYIKQCYDMEDLFSLNNTEKNGRITCGYIQVVNYFYKLSLYNNNKPKIFLVDNFELNLHPLLIKKLISDLITIFNIKHVIVTSYDPNKYTHFD